MDKNLSTLLASQETLFPTEKTGLPFIVEKDPVTNFLYIHLPPKKVNRYNHGGHKTIAPSVIYDRKKPRLVARCETDRTAFREISILQQLQGIRGVIRLFSSIKRSDDRVDIFLEYYRSSSLRSIYRGKMRIKDHELIPIFSDLLYGLKGMYSRRFIHNDIHPGNIVLHRTSKSIRAAFIDFGLAIKMDEADPEAAHFSSTNAPEVLLRTLNLSNYEKAEIYALGVALHIVVCNRRPDWVRVFYPADISLYSPEERIAKHAKIKELYKLCIKRIQRMPSGIRKDLSQLVYTMLHYDPERRSSLNEAISMLEKISKKYKN